MSKINNFFNPKTIAIIGASDHEEKVGGILLKKALASKCKIIPVNPSHEKLFGKVCYKEIGDYPGKIDMAVIAIPAPLVAGAFEECGKKGVKSIILMSAGFSEIGNVNGEEELVKISQRYNMSFIGPNCFGIFNPLKKLDLTFSATTSEKGNIAFISQSGALWSYLSDFADNSVGFSGFASLGNAASLGFSDFIDYFSKDKKTKSIILYVEKIKDGKDFIKQAKKCKKPIYAVKAGSSEVGARAAFSHTASLSSEYNIYSGAFKQAGINLCGSLLEALEKASGKKLLDSEKEKIKIEREVFIITNAGGAGALMADYLSGKGFNMKEKPLDILGTASGSDYFNAIEKIKNREDFNSVIILLTAQSMSEIKKTAEVIVGFKNQTNKIVVPIFLGVKSMVEANKIFQEAGIDYFNTLEEARDCLVFN